MSFTRRSELANNSIGGTLPPTYGSNGSFPVIGAMQVGVWSLFHENVALRLCPLWGNKR